jgi:hypothetical protein
MLMPIVVGLATGLVSAVLFASASTGTALGLFVLFFLSPFPVAVAGLGWGWPAATIATLVGTGLVAGVGTGRAAIFYAIALGAPTAVLSYLLLLSREIWSGESTAAPSGVEWYPIGRTLALAALWAGVLAAIALLTTAPDLDGVRLEIKRSIERMVKANLPVPSGPDGRSLGEAEINALTELMLATMPGIIASAWLSIAALNVWLAGHATRASGRLSRPWPDLAMISVPRGFPLLFALAIGLTFLPDYLGLIASGFASAFFFIYALIGLAILHSVTRGMAARGLILAAVYLSLLLLNPISGLLIAMAGVAEPLSPLRRKPIPPPS